jgi:hypothetical protein
MDEGDELVDDHCPDAAALDYEDASVFVHIDPDGRTVEFVRGGQSYEIDADHAVLDVRDRR